MCIISKNYQPKVLELTSDCGKVASCKVNMHKSIFYYKQQCTIGIKNTIPLINMVPIKSPVNLFDTY